MKKLSMLILLLLTLPLITAQGPAFGEMKYGALTVVAQPDTATIYVDGTYVGTGFIKMAQITVGSHLVRVTTAEDVIYEQMVNIKEGEQTTILAKKEGSPAAIRPTAPASTQTTTKPKTSDLDNKIKIGFELDYGLYNVRLGSASAQASTMTTGIGAFVSIPGSLAEETRLGLAVNSLTDDLGIIYFYAENVYRVDPISYFSFGANYSFWSSPSGKSYSGLGFQAKLICDLPKTIPGLQFGVGFIGLTGNTDVPGGNYYTDYPVFFISCEQ